MAEANSSQDFKETKDFDLECAVCLQTCIHPAQLPCGHIFCFLCVKGIALTIKKCALCRQSIPRDYVDHPTLVKWNAVLENLKDIDGQYQWFYEGRNGWWQYDERTSLDLEAAYKVGQDKCELLIAGFIYIIDFQSMVQYRQNHLSRRRRIKRDSSTIPKKGVAGLKTDKNEDCEQLTTYEKQIPITPSNTPQSPNSESQSLEEESILDRFRFLQLGTTNLSDERNNNSNENILNSSSL
ncbi:E3 ubiquitin-protein ligase rnf146 [Coccinella septempunctata]|uniref:E3 ubiquitin-protein ligase rnf146 n=1 Tax=Coccinella septempunctata TaxID=41139 RepID=UPI001D0902A5|nr:E3 ubiquitin-protein ligase rnf146 [Coccinella septempunctata]